MSFAIRPLALLFAVVVFAASCGSSSDSDTAAADSVTDATTSDASSADTSSSDTASSSAESPDGESSGVGVDVGLFFDGALAEDATTEDCTLSGGTETTCYRITVAGYPASHDVGPFCPDTITDPAEAGGIWFDGEGISDLSGEFFVELPTLYDDDKVMSYV